MPKIPLLSYDKAASPVRTNIAPLQQEPSDQGQTVSMLGQALTDMGAFLTQTYQETEGSKESTKAQRELQNFTLALQQGEIDQETGLRTPPPPPDQHEKLFNDKVESIRQRVESNLGGRALRIFDSEFNPYVARHEISVKTHALDFMHGKIRNDTDEMLHEKALDFVNRDEIEKAEIQRQATTSIERLVNQGIWTPEQGQARLLKFKDDAESGSFFRIMEQDRNAALKALDKGMFPSFSAEKTEKLRHGVYERMWQDAQRENAISERLRREEERYKREVQEETFKDLIVLESKNNLNPDIVMAKRDKLSAEQFKMFMLQATGKGAMHSDPRILAQLYIDSTKGRDVTDATVEATAKGQLTTSDMKEILGNIDRKGVAYSAENWVKEGTDFIERNLSPIPGIDDPAQKVRYAEAVRDWTRWAHAHEKTATAAEATAQYEKIVSRYALINWDKMALSLGVPDYFQDRGGRNALSGGDPEENDVLLREAAKEEKRKLDAGEIDQFSFQEQMRLLGKWQRENKKQLDIFRSTKKSSKDKKKR